MHFCRDNATRYRAKDLAHSPVYATKVKEIHQLRRGSGSSPTVGAISADEILKWGAVVKAAGINQNKSLLMLRITRDIASDDELEEQLCAPLGQAANVNRSDRGFCFQNRVTGPTTFACPVTSWRAADGDP
jgi:hypothetical protein